MPLPQIEVSVVFVKLNILFFTLNFLNKVILMYVYVSIPSAISDVYIKVLSCVLAQAYFPLRGLLDSPSSIPSVLGEGHWAGHR